MSEDIVLKIEHVDRIYEDEEKTVEAPKDINLEIKRGEFISFIGASGCGKTTTLRLIAGLDRPQGGHLYLHGEEIKKPNPKRGYIFQQGALINWLIVEGNIAAGLKARHVYKENKSRVQDFNIMTPRPGRISEVIDVTFPHPRHRGGAEFLQMRRVLLERFELASAMPQPEYNI